VKVKEKNLLAGNISNTNIWDPNDKSIQKEIRSMFSEMIGWSVDEGADFIVGETFYYAEEAYTALEEIKKIGPAGCFNDSPYG